ncbi:MAG: hypothetical protein QM527_06395 [Alphaproteobacteria bacterium]|nr:hypothetical protein [Alphaproteobacteria bacterium]
MLDHVFRAFLESGAVTAITVVRASAQKGKPARRKGGRGMIWKVRVSVGERQMYLEAVRGGAREWASLDSLCDWLELCGMHAFDLDINLESFVSKQESLELLP